MELIKDERTARFDELTRVADETLELYRDLGERLEDGHLRASVTTHIAEQSALLEEIRRRRRAREDLPEAGDPELAHLHALLARVRAALLPGESDQPVVESLLQATGHLREEIEQAIAADLAPDESRLLSAYRENCASLEEVLRKRAG